MQITSKHEQKESMPKDGLNSFGTGQGPLCTNVAYAQNGHYNLCNFAFRYFVFYIIL